MSVDILGQVVTNAEARFNKSLRPRKPEGSLGRTAQDVHLDSHTAPELLVLSVDLTIYTDVVTRRCGGDRGWTVNGCIECFFCCFFCVCVFNYY